KISSTNIKKDENIRREKHITNYIKNFLRSMKQWKNSFLIKIEPVENE
ncbi:unnamed protein product, partial [marine sediment metagenome]